VAEFVTQANFLPARRGPAGWETEVGCFSPAVDTNGEQGELAEADLMMRQEDMTLAVDEAGAVVVRDRQFLGREYKYCLQTVSGRSLYARAPVDHRIAIGSRVQITVPSQRLRLYPQAQG
jgi:iron(III) transport system ATP-binding protein